MLRDGAKNTPPQHERILITPVLSPPIFSFANINLIQEFINELFNLYNREPMKAGIPNKILYGQTIPIKVMPLTGMTRTIQAYLGHANIMQTVD